MPKLLFVIIAGLVLVACEQGAFFGAEMRRKTITATVVAYPDEIAESPAASRPQPVTETATETATATDLDPEGDEDSDGLRNAWERTLGFDPYDPDSGAEGRAQNGTLDSLEDLNADSVPIAWEIQNALDPLGPDNRIVDSDQDGYANAEEYVQNTSPSDADQHPGPADSVLVYGASLGRTNTLAVRVSVGWCGSGDLALVSSSASQPAVDAAGWVTCSTAPQALAGTLGSSSEGEHSLYVWRQNIAGVIEHPFVGNVVYDSTPPAGGALNIDGYVTQGIKLAITPPTDNDFDRFELRRYAQAVCGDAAITDGSAITVTKSTTSVTDSGLSSGTPYCYKAFWYDLSDNLTTATAQFDPSGPTPGRLTIASVNPLALNLQLTLPTDIRYNGAHEIRRYTASSCAGETAASGSVVTAAATATSVADTGLALATPYCYQVFWQDWLGNASMSVVENPYPGQQPAGSLSISGFGTYGVSGSRSIVLTHAPPSNSYYEQLNIRRYTQLDCSSESVSAGTTVPTISSTQTLLSDGNLSLATPYCYKAFWSDRFGNQTSASVPQSYDGNGPTGGDISIASRTTTSLTLNHTPPTSSNYAALSLRQVKASSCATITSASSGIGVSLANAALSVTSTGLDINTDYCFKIFWMDTFGNVSSDEPTGVPIPSKTLDDGCCWQDPQQSTWYLGNGGGIPVHATATYGFDYGATTITQAISSLEPNFLTLTTSLPTTDLLYSGSPTATLPLTPWSVLLNGSHVIHATTRVINWATPNYSVPTSITLADNTPSATLISAALDSDYDGVDPSIKPLWGDVDIAASSPTSSLGAASIAVSDIPNLAYAESACASLAVPTLCPRASSYDANSKTVSGGFDLLWNYSRFDQGRYEIKTLPYLNVDGARLYHTAKSTEVVLPDTGNEQLLLQNNSAIGEGGEFFTAGTWATYRPSLALSQSLSSQSEQVYAVVYPAFRGNYNQYIGAVSLEHANDSAYIAFDDSASTYRISGHTLDDGADAESMAIVAAESSTSGAIVASSVVSASGGVDMVLTKVDLSAAPGSGLINPSFTAATQLNVSQVSDATFVNNVAISPAFADQATPGSPIRHGLAFFGAIDGGAADIYVTKIRSQPTSISKNDFFDATNFYQSDNNNPLRNLVPSVRVTRSDLATTDISMVRIVHRDEGTHDQFYVAWRNGAEVQFAKLQADSPTTPTVSLTKTNHQIIQMSANFGTFGRPAYEISAGEDSQGNAVFGVLFVRDTSSGSGRCWFRAYKDNSGLEKATTVDIAIGTATDCRFPNLYWNEDSKKFLALWVDGAGGATQFAEFQVDLSANPSVLVPVNPQPVTITLPRTSGQKVCNLAAHYAAAENANKSRRIGIVSVEMSNCASTQPANLRLDTYRPGR